MPFILFRLAQHKLQYCPRNSFSTFTIPMHFPKTVPPRVLSGPENFSITEGDDIHITCSISGIPAPTATWFQGQMVVTPGKRYRVETTLDTATLVVPKATVKDSAEFTLKLENPVGKDEFKVNVEVKRK